VDSSSSLPLRQQLVDELRKVDCITSEPVASAFLKVPREAFIPGVRAEEANKDVVVATRFDRQGRATSSSSQPAIMARMLEMLRVEPGQNILEIGAATGYNAALLQELAGRAGKVTSVETQPDLAAQAAEHLRSYGYGDVQIITGDGNVGYQPSAPFDRIIITASCGDISVEWWEQLRQGGVLVLPLWYRAVQAVVSLGRVDSGFTSEKIVYGGFMNMQGSLDPGGTIRYLGALRDLGVVRRPRAPRLDYQALYELLSEGGREEQPEALARVFPDGHASWGAWMDFRWFLASCGVWLFDLLARNPIYGFRSGSAVVGHKTNSIAVLALDPAAPGSGQRPVPVRLLTYGTDAARDHLVSVAQEFVAKDSPRLDRLGLTVARKISRVATTGTTASSTKPSALSQ
jgi:protein-L-isoaspartate(D-aspartate) O-methyltransferase